MCYSFCPEYERNEDEFLESFTGKKKEINIKLSIQQIQKLTFSYMMYVLKNDNVAREPKLNAESIIERRGIGIMYEIIIIILEQSWSFENQHMFKEK